MKLPIGFSEPPGSPGVVVARNIVTHVSRMVKWTCAVVWSAFGNGKEISCGL
jgi:hypothetical protein